jgi:hypothetical protein
MIKANLYILSGDMIGKDNWLSLLLATDPILSAGLILRNGGGIYEIAQ